MDIVFTPYKKVTTGKREIYYWITFDTLGRDADKECPIENHYVLGNYTEEFGYDSQMASPTGVNSHTIPLTQANFDFFVNLCEQLDLLNKKILNFIGSPDELQQKIITGNVHKLLGE